LFFMRSQYAIKRQRDRERERESQLGRRNKNPDPRLNTKINAWQIIYNLRLTFH